MAYLINFLLNRGLAVVFAEDIPSIANEKPPRKFFFHCDVTITESMALSVEAWSDLCPIFDALPPQTFP
jgi:hypothetical protein